MEQQNRLVQWIDNPLWNLKRQQLQAIHGKQAEGADFSGPMLYGVTTGNLNKAVARNRERFPSDFMFQLSDDEVRALRSQNVISNEGRGGRRNRPFVFSEQGVAMLSSVLHSPQAIAVNIEIMRAFARMRRWAVGYAELARRIDELEAKYDGQFALVFDAIRKLMEPPAAAPREMGFHTIHHKPESDAKRRSQSRR